MSAAGTAFSTVEGSREGRALEAQGAAEGGPFPAADALLPGGPAELNTPARSGRAAPGEGWWEGAQGRSRLGRADRLGR